MKVWMACGGLAAAMLSGSGPLRAATGPAEAGIPIKNGMNHLVLDGKEAIAFRALRENFNAHGFDVVSFYVHDTAEDGTSTWQLVPLFGSYDSKDDIERDELKVSGGADCQLHDFRLLKSVGSSPVRLIVADRDPGSSYADAANVHFSYFDLAKNDDGVPGLPPFYFKLKDTKVSSHKYCDVNEALDKELHLKAADPDH
jgi:hypothetical protein